MARNVLIFCDGTGQVGGVHFDEPRTNIYKMYRAMRCGPDSAVDPATQIAFYDPGIGSTADGGRLIGGLVRSLYNIVAQATGFGITRNIVDCYAAVIRLWRPGDRIWIFGFSRGAYTARCLSEVLSLCGIPRRDGTGKPLALDQTSVRAVAAYAVRRVYQFTSPCPPGATEGRRAELDAVRLRLATAFRDRHGARIGVDDGTYPYFVGCFDTVAALINRQVAIGLGAVALFASVFVACASSLTFSAYGDRWATFGWVWLAIVSAVVVVGIATYVWTHLQFEVHADWRSRFATAHMTEAYQTFYDRDLDPNISYAKHAISIDENRAAFARVKWGHGHRRPTDDAARRPWFEQVWFAGDHADVGGGYGENESRLSDVSLEWMVDCACEVPGGLRYDPAVLRSWPCADGPQHDQVKAGFGWLTRLTGLTWPAAFRERPTQGITLHRSVYDRFDASDVPHWDGVRRYRPVTLQGYADVAAFYAVDVLPGTLAIRDSLARTPPRASMKPASDAGAHATDGSPAA